MGFMDFFSSKQKQEVDMGPWRPQQPYILKGFEEAEKLLDEGGPQYFPGPTLAPRHPLITGSEDALMGYAGGDQFRQMMDKSYGATTDRLGGGYFGYSDIFNDPNVGDAYKQLVSGDSSPYTEAAARATREDMMEDYSGIGGPAQQIRESQIRYQPGGGSRGDLMNRRAQDELDENMRQITAGMYERSYGDAQNRMLAGVGQADAARRGMGSEDLSRYGTAMGYVPQQYEMEMGAYGVPGQVGYDRQAYDQATIDDQVKRFQYEQSLPYNTLDWYKSQTGGNYGQSGSTTSTSTPSPYSVGKQLFNDATGVISTGMGLFGGGGGVPSAGGGGGGAGSFGGVPYTKGLSLYNKPGGSYFG